MQKVWNVLVDAIGKFDADDGWALASHIAMSGLIAIFPFLIFLTALAGFLGSAELAEDAVRLLFETWPTHVSEPIAREVHNVLTQSRGGLLTLGVVLSLYFASSGVEALRTGLNRAYALRDPRLWWVLRLQSIFLVFVGAVALLIYAFLLVLGPLLWQIAVQNFPTLAPIAKVVTILRFGVTILALGIALVILHRWLPCKRHSYRQVAPGILLTLVFSALFGELFGIYLSEFATNYVSTYAGLASVMIALGFLYAIASIFLLGGELNAALLRRAAREAHSVNADLTPR